MQTAPREISPPPTRGGLLVLVTASALDKTGTVTIGAPAVTHITLAAGASEEQLFTVAASCGFGSLHPVSRAVVVILPATTSSARVKELSPRTMHSLPELPWWQLLVTQEWQKLRLHQ